MHVLIKFDKPEVTAAEILGPCRKLGSDFHKGRSFCYT